MFLKPSVLERKPASVRIVRVRGWNQAVKVGGGGTVGGLPARNGKGGACLRTLHSDADPHAHAALMSNL